MVGHLAVGVTATQAGAGVNAVKVPALLVGGTVGVDYTLWPTCHVRVTEVVRDTSAGSSISVYYRLHCHHKESGCRGQ
jgi:hypothetical protein